MGFKLWEGVGGLFGLLAELDEGSAGALGVEEGNVETFGALAGSLVDNAAAFAFELAQGVGDSVGDVERDVLDASAAAVAGNKLGYGAVFRGAFQELELGLPQAEECGAHLLVSYFFNGEALYAKHVFIEGDCLVERGNGDADVFNMGDFHNCDVEL